MSTSEQLEKNLDRIHEWIRSADQKISVMLAFQGVVFTILAPKILVWFKVAANSGNVFSAILFSIGGALLAYSLFEIFRALIPNLHNKSTHRSLTFFGDISSFSLTELNEKLGSATDDEIRRDLVQQIHISAQIASLKHGDFKSSVTHFAQGCIAFSVGWLLLHVIIYVQ